MKRITPLLFGLLVSLLMNRELYARFQESPQPMKLDECIEAARQNNHGLKAARAKVLAADAKASEAMSSLLPQVRLSSRFARLSDIQPFTFAAPGFGTLTLFPNIDHSYSARVALQQPVFTGLRLLKNLEMARLNAAASQEDFLKDEADMVLEVKLTYWNLSLASQFEHVLSQTVTQVSEHLKDIRNFYQQGLATENDVYKVQIQLADVKVKLIEAESNKRLMAMALNNLMGKPLEKKILPIEDPEGLALPKDTEFVSVSLPQEMIEHARDHRPELKAMRSRKAMGEASVAAARAGWFPQIALSANYDYARPNSRIIPPKDEWQGTWDLGLTLQWNIWDWFTTAHQTTQAKAALMQTEEGIADLENAVNMQVAQGYFKMYEARNKQAVAKQGVDQATESYRITTEKFKKGVTTNTELLDAEVALLQAKLTYTQTNIDYQIAYARVIHAAGFQSGPPQKNQTR